MATSATPNSTTLTDTTQDDIRRHMIEDGEDPDISHDDWYPSPASVRRKLGLSQAQLADNLRLPLGTWRNWEQGRVELDPAVRALLLCFGVSRGPRCARCMAARLASMKVRRASRPRQAVRSSNAPGAALCMRASKAT